MSPGAYILATAGHVDHGKSALVKALTGTDPDRLPEEKARGMTIELGFAHLNLPAPPGAPFERLNIGIIDVPGHEDFVKNMVAGVGSIDAALIVVAVDDGWMPQTEEHLQILLYLGVTRAIVALTKTDLAGNVAIVEEAIRHRLAGTALAAAPILRTSVKENIGLDRLREALAGMFAESSPAPDVGKPRLSVDRAFTLKGVGTVVTGTLTGGTLQRGQEVVLQPRGLPTKIRALQTHGKDVQQAGPAMRVAFNLTGVAPADASAHETNLVHRGDVVTIPMVGKPASSVDVLLERSPRAGGHPFRSGTVVWIHHGTAAFAARVRMFDLPELSAGARSTAKLILRSPGLFLAGDRFIVRDWSEQQTLAGGIALDVDPPGGRKRAIQGALLEMRAANPYSMEHYVLSQVIRDGVCDRAAVVSQSRFSRQEVDGAIDAACHSGALISAASVVAAPQAWAELLSQAREAIDAVHRAHPERPGLPLAELKRIVGRRTAAEGAPDAVMRCLTADGFACDAGVIRRANHLPALHAILEPAGKRLRAALAKCPFDPPARGQLTPDDLSMRALKFLIARGEAVEINSDLVFSQDAYKKAVAVIRSHIQQNGAATVSELKTALASTRRVVVPLLEKLDRDGITRRDGDKRQLR